MDYTDFQFVYSIQKKKWRESITHGGDFGTTMNTNHDHTLLDEKNEDESRIEEKKMRKNENGVNGAADRFSICSSNLS